VTEKASDANYNRNDWIEEKQIYVQGCTPKSVELPIHRPSLYAYLPLLDQTIGGFPQNLVKGNCQSNSWRYARETAFSEWPRRPVANEEDSTDLLTASGT